MRHVLSRVTGALALCLGVAAAHAQPYPSNPVRFIAPFAAGGATDVLTRLVAAELAQDLGRAFIVENRAGAGGNIGMEAIAKAAPDGYTLGIGAGATMSINPTLYPSLPYDTAKDFAPVHVLVVNNSVPAASLAELIAHLKANPGRLSFGSPGTGTTGHLYGELFKKTAGVEMTHIPFKGGNQVRQELIAGTLQLMFSTLVEAQAQVNAGKLRVTVRATP